MLNLQKSIENLAKDTINKSIKDLTAKNLIRNVDAEIMNKTHYTDKAFNMWQKQNQMSSRCPKCQIDIKGPRELMHAHLKWHNDQHNRGEIKDNEAYTSDFRIHYT